MCLPCLLPETGSKQKLRNWENNRAINHQIQQHKQIQSTPKYDSMFQGVIFLLQSQNGLSVQRIATHHHKTISITVGSETWPTVTKTILLRGWTKRSPPLKALKHSMTADLTNSCCGIIQNATHHKSQTRHKGVTETVTPL